MFPVLRLPIPAFDQIYDCLDVPEIIHLSQCSKRLKTIVKSRETPKQARVIYIDMNKDYAKVQIGRERKQPFTWNLSSERDYQVEDLENFEERKIDETTWRIARTPTGWFSVPEAGEYEKDLLALVSFFKALFKCPIHSIKFSFGDIWDFDKLLVETDTLHEARAISVGPSALHKGEMDFMLDHFTSKNLLINGYPGKKYNYPGTLNFEKIGFSCATWIGLEMLEKMTLTCKQISLESASLITDIDLNQFIKNWIAGDNRSLEQVKISRMNSVFLRNLGSYRDTPPLVRSVILDGIQSSPGAKKRREAAKYASNYYKYENGVDIRRADGLMATVLVIQESYRGEFLFTVWYDKEPNLVGSV